MIQRFGKFLIRISPLIAMLCIVLEIVLTNRLAGSGQEVRSIDMAIDGIRTENELLEQQVASASSLLTISTKASELGLVPPLKSQVLTMTPGELPVALNNPR